MSLHKSKGKEIGLIVTILVAIVLFSLQYCDEKREQHLLEYSKKTFAVIKKISHGSVRNPKHCYLKYSVDTKQYELRQSGDYTSFQIGDTVLIEYSIKDHSVARVIDKYYMQKYRPHKK